MNNKMSTPIIKIKDIGKVFPKADGHRRLETLKDVSLTIHQGEFLVLLGPSGCGKSTLLRILAGLIDKTSGEIAYGENFNPEKISFVFQNFGLLPWLSVFQNVELNLIAKNIPKHEREKEVHAILKPFGLLDFEHHFPHELSGGMKQRVGLARAFVSKPEVIFLDEPFSELDFYTATNLRQILLDLWKELGTTVIMVSHYIDEAISLSDRIAVFSDRPGTITSVITNDLSRPRDPRSKEFYNHEDEVLKYFGNRGGI